MFQKKVFSTLTSFCGVSALALGQLACGGNPNLLSGKGSNSVTAITSLINEKTQHTLNYENLGSTLGAREMAKAQISYDFAMTSSRKTPGSIGKVEGINYSDPTTGFAQEVTNWLNNQIRTLTFAWDAIGIGLNLPDPILNSLRLNDQDRSNDIIPRIKFDALVAIYCLSQDDQRYPTWQEFLTNPEVTGLDSSLFKPEESKPRALAIEGGKDTSGKAEAFTDKIVASESFAALGVDKKLVQTHSDSIIAPELKVEDKENTMYGKNANTASSVMYYSLGYIIKNDRQSKVVLAEIDGWGAPTVANAQNGSYDWIRPFNILYPVSKTKVIEMVKTLLSPEFQSEIARLGFVALSSEQISLQSGQPSSLTLPDLAAEGLPSANQIDGLDFGLKVK
ncbi:hypothetical protein [Mycoplasma sp. ATU-Cv-508]|uniref:hypothetical protein n=1 Tax=Mycoplasma sp. ATU-Cv-508 TaxID=2048001 RepID=UPI000FDF203B